VPDPSVLTPGEAASRLGLSTRTLSRWREEGNGPPYLELPRGLVRYPVAEFEAWLTDRQRNGGARTDAEGAA
jgi:predicted DNA-binding transcriptional regulator AlpA